MRFGIREICDVVLRAKSYQTLGKKKFFKNEPVLYFDSLKTSSLEGAATTVYAQGGRGNTRLVAWEGERTLTFTMEDALLSMESFSVLSGAGLIDATEEKPIYVHQTSQVLVEEANTIVVPDTVCWNKAITNAVSPKHRHGSADIFVMVLKNGEVDAEPCVPVSVKHNEDGSSTLTCYSHAGNLPVDAVVLVDYYVLRTTGAQMMEITADKFGGNYYLEASTLFRNTDGVDMPAEFVIPNCKIQSNFTFSMAATGDPSTFTFTMDAFPDYTKFDPSHKVLAAIQVITDESGKTEASRENCFGVSTHEEGLKASVLDDNTVVVTGKSDGVSYDQSLFGNPATNGIKGAEVTVSLPVNGAGSYTVIQKNPALQDYSTDPAVKENADGEWVKTKSYTVGADDTLEYSFLISKDHAGEGDIEITFSGNNVATQTYKVLANVAFDD